ncbi:MAG: hypothetical protein HN377_11900 [Alphaproteobacteria bacterium]|jgi:hypothetical protein|nr:hypothetical protein [Alphaproteobacteria bacterium]
MHYRLSDVAEVAGLAHGSARVMRHRGQLGIARYAHRLSLTDACIIVLTGRLTDLLGMPAAGAARIASQARAIIAEVAGRWDRGGDDDTFLVFFTLPGGIWCEPAHGRMEYHALLDVMTAQSEHEPRLSLNLSNLVMTTAGALKQNKKYERAH